ncbi:MAG TPA: c-type cytochrome [Polyangiaceae bacterium]|nr:c-type cytochrome [Polyangiaceae bacterium]
MSPVKLPFRSLVVAAALLAPVAACSVTPLGAKQENLTAAHQKASPGASVYRRECVSCHGERGEGLAQAPAVMGSGALPLYERDPATSTNPALQDPAERLRTANLPPGADVRGAFRTAEDLFKYISREMPLPRSKAGSLKAEEYWALTNFILLGHGVALPAGGVSPSNAAQVPMKPAE